jgi:hypothetical protein
MAKDPAAAAEAEGGVVTAANAGKEVRRRGGVVGGGGGGAAAAGAAAAAAAAGRRAPAGAAGRAPSLPPGAAAPAAASSRQRCGAPPAAGRSPRSRPRPPAPFRRPALPAQQVLQHFWSLASLDPVGWAGRPPLQPRTLLPSNLLPACPAVTAPAAARLSSPPFPLALPSTLPIPHAHPPHPPAQQDERAGAVAGLVSDLLASQAAFSPPPAAAAAAPAPAPRGGHAGGTADAAAAAALGRCSPLMVYAMRRLVRGLASSRDGARQGYAAALAVLLRHAAGGLGGGGGGKGKKAKAAAGGGGAAAAATAGWIDMAGVLALIEACLPVSGSMKGTVGVRGGGGGCHGVGWVKGGRQGRGFAGSVARLGGGCL